MNCIGCFKKIKRGEFVTLNGGALVKTKTGGAMGGKNLMGFLTVSSHFDSKKNYKCVSLTDGAPNGQFEFYACSYKCLIEYLTRNILMLEKLNKIKKISIAPSKNVNRIGSMWVEMVLRIIGYPQALVTDESTLWDFLPFRGKGQKQLLNWGERLGFKIKGSDRIWEIAKKLSKKGM